METGLCYLPNKKIIDLFKKYDKTFCFLMSNTVVNIFHNYWPYCQTAVDIAAISFHFQRMWN